MTWEFVTFCARQMQSADWVLIVSLPVFYLWMLIVPPLVDRANSDDG